MALRAVKGLRPSGPVFFGPEGHWRVAPPKGRYPGDAVPNAVRYTITLPAAPGTGSDIFTVVDWRKGIGDLVSQGDVVAVVRPAGAEASRDIEVTSPAYGILARKVVLPGEGIEVGEPLAILSGVPEPLTPTNGVPEAFAESPLYIPAGPEESVVLSPGARMLAAHNARSLRTSPHVYTVATVDMGEVLRLQSRVAPGMAMREGATLGVLPFILSVVGAALEQHPSLNAQLIEKTGEIRRKRYVAIGFPLRMGDERITVPVVREPQKKSILALTREVSDLIARAQVNALRPDEQRGATFAVTEEAATGTVLYQTPILHQPQAAILSLGAVMRTPIAQEDDTVAVRPIVHLCLAHDARIVANGEAAEFLAAIKRGLEETQFLFT